MEYDPHDDICIPSGRCHCNPTEGDKRWVVGRHSRRQDWYLKDSDTNPWGHKKNAKQFCNRHSAFVAMCKVADSQVYKMKDLFMESITLKWV